MKLEDKMRYSEAIEKDWLIYVPLRDVNRNLRELFRWIPVTERLPELHRSKCIPNQNLEQSNLFEDYYMISEPVLVTRTNPFIEPEEQIVVAQYEDDLDGRTYWQTVDAEQLVDVVAWMPLPEPWEGGKDD